MGASTLLPSLAEQDFAQAFARMRGGHPEGEREKAFARFSRAGLPTRKVESWHYTDLRGKLRQAPPLASAPTEADRVFAASLRDREAATNTLKLVLVDGFFAPDLSDDISAVAGLTVRALTAAQDSAALGEGVADALLDLNAVFAGDGVAIEIAAGARIEKPIEILSLCCATGAQSRFSRQWLTLGAGAQAALLETRAEGVGGFGDSALFLDLGDDARLDYACRCEGSAPVEVQSVVAILGARSHLRATALLADAPFLRRQFYVNCRGEGAEVHLAGAALLSQQNHADTTLQVVHDAPSCFSRETFKYVLADDAEGVFQGRIVAQPHAQKTDGKMLCRALVLSDKASMSVKPELEIFADDVACGHGASCAKLDASELFYMESRGIPHAEAQAILIEAFASEAFDILPDGLLRDVLQADLARILATGVFG
jgi:Fe-S cluster assembly protein SufD